MKMLGNKYRIPELRLTFLCCHPTLGGIDPLALTLRIVSGFTAREIAELFLSNSGAIAQRLSRSKRKLREISEPLIEAPTVFEIESRLDSVLTVIYLMFSIGYSPRSGPQLIRRDVALEAVRLARELADGKHTGKPAAKALAALLCFQASRLNARQDAIGSPVLLQNQDRRKWDGGLIALGVEYLGMAMTGNKVTRYHLEAGISSVYATAANWDAIDWDTILNYFDRLEKITDSPVVGINAAVAQACAGQPEQALDRLNTILLLPTMARYTPIHIARAEILRLLDRDDEADEEFFNRDCQRCVVACCSTS